MGKRKKRKPIVAIVGRPNVGKSTLFNRVVGERLAIVESIPGTTRDRLYADASWIDTEFTLVDTGGLEVGREKVRGKRRKVEPLAEGSVELVEEMREQAELAIDEADVIIMLTEVKGGATAIDAEIADMLRKSRKPVILAVNKADNPARQEDVVEFYQLGLGEPIPISAIHGLGIPDLLDEVAAKLPHFEEREEEAELLHLAIVGRPNVGKSSLLNALVGKERAIVSDIPGTTRDAIDTQITWEGKKIVLVDTAGIRKRGAIKPGLEKYSVIRSMRAVQRADVALVLIDATTGITAQDTHIAGYVVEEGRGLVLVVNKWDAIEKDAYTMSEFMDEVRQKFDFASWAPVLFISAKTKQRIHQVIPTAYRVWEAANYRIPTSDLNRIVQNAVLTHPPAIRRGKPLKFFYATQVGVEPPTFVIFVNRPEDVHFSYQRYIENKIREFYPYEGTPIRLLFKEKSGKRKRR